MRAQSSGQLVGCGLAANIAAVAINPDLFTSVCPKIRKVVTTEGLKTPSQIIIMEVQINCNEEDVGT